MLERLRGCLVALALVAGMGAAQAQQTPDVGQTAPNFMLMTPEGTRISLSDAEKKGTVVLVVLRGYPGYQCPYCVKQVHDFEENATGFAQAGATVLLVYPGPPANLDEHAKEFMTKENPMPAGMMLLLDPDYKFTNRYGLRWEKEHETAYPSTFVIDRLGTVLFRKVSEGHGDRTTAAEVLAELPKVAPVDAKGKKKKG